jgi:prevent-host-death family protein
MKRLQALQVRKGFGGVLDTVANQHEPVVIERAGRPLVVMVPFDQYQAEHDQTTRRERLERVALDMDRWAKRNAKTLAGFDPIHAIRHTRSSR